ncbi:MAG: IS66 family insertion sequence element accessory protein TnpB [bacterium]|nr:IS66 family insertion sequence element accessory protein TnpB [bacterium]
MRRLAEAQRLRGRQAQSDGAASREETLRTRPEAAARAARRQGSNRYGAPTDMRKGFDGLYGMVREALGRDPLSGDLYLFVSRNRIRAKVLLWDGAVRLRQAAGARPLRLSVGQGRGRIGGAQRQRAAAVP